MIVYKGTTKKVKEIGRELEVGSILEGTFKKSGNRIRVTIQLIDVAGDKHLWAQSYDRELNDVFEVQSDVAKQVADSLSVKIPQEEELIRKEPTQDLEAYQLYLKGRYLWNQRTKESIYKAINYYQYALDKDPRFALAYSGMAYCYVVLPGFDPLVSEREVYRKARQLSMGAIELDDTLAEAHTALGVSLANHDWDRKGGEREVKRAIEINPSYATGHYFYGLYLSWFAGRFEEAIKELRRATGLDPLSPIMGSNLAAGYVYTSRLDEAIAQCKKVLDLEPNHSNAIWWLEVAYLLKSMYKEAIGEAEKFVRLLPDKTVAKANLGLAFGMAGMRDKVNEILGELLGLSKKQRVPPEEFISLYFSIGEMSKMYDWMQVGYDEHGIGVPEMRWHPLFKKLWTDPKFLDFMKKVGLE